MVVVASASQIRRTGFEVVDWGDLHRLSFYLYSKYCCRDDVTGCEIGNLYSNF